MDSSTREIGITNGDILLADQGKLLLSYLPRDSASQPGDLVCTTGIGISSAANKVAGIRCAHCADCLQAEMTRRHNDANMMAIGAGFTGKNMAERMVEVFLATEFEGGRHARRVDLMNEI